MNGYLYIKPDIKDLKSKINERHEWHNDSGLFETYDARYRDMADYIEEDFPKKSI